MRRGYQAAIAVAGVLLLSAVADGSYSVGSGPGKVPAGTYSAPGGARCTWIRLGPKARVLSKGGGKSARVVIAASDVMFRATGCGDWQRVTTTAPPSRESVAQKNARQKGASYLKMSAFSRSGLIDQLQFEGFSVTDATYGVDALNANWNEQAAKKAASYLKMSAFSHSGLVDQLVFEGFTPAQAEFGVGSTGL